jgi:hypothetical protein
MSPVHRDAVVCCGMNFALDQSGRRERARIPNQCIVVVGCAACGVQHVAEEEVVVSRGEAGEQVVRTGASVFYVMEISPFFFNLSEERSVMDRVVAAEAAHAVLAAEVTALKPRLAAVRARSGSALGVATKRRLHRAPAAGDGAGVTGSKGNGPAAATGHAAVEPTAGYHLDVLGTIRSCFKQKFGIPRQPGLAPLAVAELVLNRPWSAPDAVRGLEGWSHVWISFIFHGITLGPQFKSTVTPPRGEDKYGVFATRTTHRSVSLQPPHL